MRAANIFINDLEELGLLDKVKQVKITLCVSLRVFSFVTEVYCEDMDLLQQQVRLRASCDISYSDPSPFAQAKGLCDLFNTLLILNSHLSIDTIHRRPSSSA